MGIPESQLETWSHQGAVTTSSQVYQSIRAALTSDKSLIKDKINNKKVSVYLQGSYGNSTNIYADSDVDVVVEHHTTWGYDISALSNEEQVLFRTIYPDATYSWEHFRRDVLQSLRAYYGTAVEERKKVLAVNVSSYRMTADVLPAIGYRRYYQFKSDRENISVDGIRFHVPSENNRTVINYPDWHRYYGTKKHEETDGQYKPTVRMFKNARNHLIDNGVIADGLMPSYFLECTLFNVPNEHFVSSLQETFYNILKFLNGANVDIFQCQNGQLPLIGETPEQLRKDNLTAFRRELINLWNKWGS